MRQRLVILCLSLSLLFTSALAHAEKAALKEWTFLVFLNGHNNLDPYGSMNIKQMEKVGSTDQLNMVVQWASMDFNTTKRLLVTKSTDPSRVTSPIVEELPVVDMGDPKALVEFVRWAAQRYPAKRYFLDVWNHGGGWHRIYRNGFQTNDISFDDRTGNSISTKELGQAVDEIARVLGQKLDVYASDACLMAMAEVAYEMKDSASVFLGSEEVEPGEGWPYDTFLAELAAAPYSSAAEAAKFLSKHFLAAYSGGQYGRREVTMSVLDLTKFDNIAAQMKNLSEEIKKLDAAKKRQVLETAQATESYDYNDYKDLKDFVLRLERKGGLGIRANVLANLRDAVSQAVIANDVSQSFRNSHGISFWFPNHRGIYDEYSRRYSELNFDKDTSWGSVLNGIY